MTAWKLCRIGSCHRHEQCMYVPCRSQGIEAGTGETAQQARSQRDESPVPEGDAPNA